MRSTLFAVLLLMSAYVQSQEKPKLIVGIVVDQMRADYIHRYWDVFEDDGFKKLVNEGFFCKNTHFNYVPTYTGPGHASIYTGTTPMNHGIIANTWFDKHTGESQYCAGDDDRKTVGSDTDKGEMSPKNMLAPSLGDAVRIASQFKGKSIGISIKDRGAILPAGHSANAAYWMDYNNGKMITSDYYMESLPTWIEAFNGKKHPDNLASQGWELSLAPEFYTASTQDNTPYERSLNEGVDPVFPYDVEVAIKADSYYKFACTPHGNTLLRLMADQCIVNEKLGQDEHTDLLAISFSSPDMIGHMYGPQSMEIEDTYIKLDREIALLIKSLNDRVGEGNYMLFLTADHAAAQVPAYLADHKIPVDYFDAEGLEKALSQASIDRFGEDLIQNISNQQVFIDRAKLNETKLELKTVTQAIAAAALEYPGVANALDIKQLQHALPPDQFAQMASLGWNPLRSGDVVIQYLPGWMSYKNKGTTHGSSFNYDSHVPLLFYGAGIEQGESIEPVRITQIVPTVCLISNIALPDASEHEPVDFD